MSLRRTLLALSLLPVASLAVRAADVPPLPRLAVVISVDQMRADFLDRFGPHFGEGGFRRFMDGLIFTDCHYRHAVTKTGPGHAVMMTGVHANRHGIIANDWRLRTWPVLEQVNCVEDREVALVGLAPRAWRSPGGLLEAKQGRSPRPLLAPTVGDRLKERFGVRSKVFGVADKDRAAILMSGRQADGAYWIEEGRVVTSTYYRPALPDYLVAFNAEGRAERTHGQVWDRLREAALYEAVQGPDDAPGEADAYGLTRVFPKRVDGGGPGISADFFEAFDHTPWNNDLVADLALAVLRQEGLGQDDGAPDLLAIGFAQPDKIGHAYGPDSHEVMDSFLRLDRTLAALFAALDEAVGLEHCLIVLSSDHGVAPLPERQLAAGVPAGRVEGTSLDEQAAAVLAAKFGAPPEGRRWAARDGLSYHLDPGVIAERGLTVAEVGAALAAGLSGHPAVAAAFTRERLADPTPLDRIGEAVRLSHHAERSGDVQYVLKPYFMDRRETTGTTHGQPYAYDQHVPLAWFGGGIEAGRRDERVGVDEIAPTLARRLGVEPPAADARAPLF